jgi:hypothetical protein
MSISLACGYLATADQANISCPLGQRNGTSGKKNGSSINDVTSDKKQIFFQRRAIFSRKVANKFVLLYKHLKRYHYSQKHFSIFGWPGGGGWREPSMSPPSPDDIISDKKPINFELRPHW